MQQQNFQKEGRDKPSRLEGPKEQILKKLYTGAKGRLMEYFNKQKDEKHCFVETGI